MRPTSSTVHVHRSRGSCAKGTQSGNNESAFTAQCAWGAECNSEAGSSGYRPNWRFFPCACSKSEREYAIANGKRWWKDFLIKNAIIIYSQPYRTRSEPMEKNVVAAILNVYAITRFQSQHSNDELNYFEKTIGVLRRSITIQNFRILLANQLNSIGAITERKKTAVNIYCIKMSL